MKSVSPVLIHVPHSSTFIPTEEWQFFVSPRLVKEILCMTDHFCDDLFDCGPQMLRFPISRLVCDVERFRDDSQEIMFTKGMGVAYTKCSDGTELRCIPDKHKDFILREYYDRHHQLLERAVSERLDKYNSCIIVDGHSFMDKPLPYEYNRDTDRPEICIGTDSFHTPEGLTEYLVDEFKKRGYVVGVNAPFEGTIVPMQYYHCDTCGVGYD